MQFPFITIALTAFILEFKLQLEKDHKNRPFVVTKIESDVAYGSFDAVQSIKDLKTCEENLNKFGRDMSNIIESINIILVKYFPAIHLELLRLQ